MTFQIANKIDFIEDRELQAFVLIEEAGNSLPSFQLTFTTSDESILHLLHEENDLKVSYGKDQNNLLTSILVPLKIESARVGENKRQITCSGLYSALLFLGNSNLFLSSKKSGLEVLKDIASKYFKVIGNVDKSKDSQVWIQHNITDRTFLNNLWLRSDLGDSFPSIGITSDGRFVLKDTLKFLKEDYDWRFVTELKDTTKDILYDPDPVFSFDSSLVNNWTGYGRQKLIYNPEEGTTTYVKELADNFIANNKSVVKREGIEKRFAAIGVVNDNVHPNYHSSYQYNIANLAQLSSLKLTLSFSGEFKDVKVLDKVLYLEDSVNDLTNKSAEYHSGTYIVSKVSRSFSTRVLTTLVQICREAPNKTIKG